MKTNPNNIFVDTNVLIGAWSDKASDKKCLEIEYADMEDNIQYVISRKYNCLYFITNNKKDYSGFVNIDTLLPAQIRLIDKD
ncbi:hypothetical protein FACS189432_02480 [Bacteroidia bacterium]|nr:hypothetical protein FACS189426_00540 [Bacteroidia bacterium]GHT26976.1 hypothetical protein FACS189432_02480 [Bacteroidia bacterium]